MAAPGAIRSVRRHSRSASAAGGGPSKTGGQSTVRVSRPAPRAILAFPSRATGRKADGIGSPLQWEKHRRGRLAKVACHVRAIPPRADGGLRTLKQDAARHDGCACVLRRSGILRRRRPPRACGRHVHRHGNTATSPGDRADVSRGSVASNCCQPTHSSSPSFG